MKIIIEIPDEAYEDVKKAGGCYYDFGKAIVNGIPISNNATNGDVIKSLFPHMKFQQSSFLELIRAFDENNMIATTHYSPIWWNAPYESKAESEIEQNLEWIYSIFDKDKIKAHKERLTKEAEERGMTLIEYLESIDPSKEENK